METNEKTLRETTEQFASLDFEEPFMPEQNVEPKTEQEGEEKPVKTEVEPLEVDDDAFSAKRPEETDDLYFNNVYNNFRELGLLSDAADLEEGKVLTNEELVSILDENSRKKARKMYEDEFLSRIQDEDAREYLNYVMQGGNSQDFFQQRINSPVVDINGDINDEKVQNKIISKYMSQFENMDEEEISEQIQMYSDAGKKEKYARMYLDRMRKYDEAQKEDLRKRAEYEEQQVQQNYQRVYNAYKSEIDATESVFGVKCDDSKRQRLMGMFFNPVKLDDGNVATEFQIRLSNALNDPKKAIVLADMLFNDFDVSKYSKAVETAVTRKIRSGLDGKPKVKKNQTSPFD